MSLGAMTEVASVSVEDRNCSGKAAIHDSINMGHVPPPLELILRSGATEKRRKIMNR